MTSKKTNVLAISDDPETQLMTERALSVKNDVGWDVPVKRNKLLAGAELDEWIENKENQHNITLVELGFGYAAKKHELGHGLFISWIKETGRSPRSVQEASKIARLIHSLSNSNARRAAHLPQRKIAVLASAPPALVNDLFDNDELQEDMSREDMREIIQLNIKVEDLATKLDTEVMKNLELKQQLSNKKSDSGYPDFVEAARHESTALTEKASLCFDDLEKLYQQLEDMGRKGKSKDTEYTRHWNLAATSVYHNVRGMVARAEKFLMELDQVLPSEVTGPVLPTQYLTEKEVIAAIQQRELLIEQHTHEAAIRKQQRDMKKPRGRGRPAKGSKK